MFLSCRMWHVKETVSQCIARRLIARGWHGRHALRLWVVVLGLFAGAESIWG